MSSCPSSAGLLAGLPLSGGTLSGGLLPVSVRCSPTGGRQTIGLTAQVCPYCSLCVSIYTFVMELQVIVSDLGDMNAAATATACRSTA